MAKGYGKGRPSKAKKSPKTPYVGAGIASRGIKFIKTYRAKQAERLRRAGG